MNTMESKLSMRHSEALNRWVELDKAYGDKLPRVLGVGSGRPLPRFVMTSDYLADMEALDLKRKAARDEYDEASLQLSDYRARERSL